MGGLLPSPPVDRAKGLPERRVYGRVGTGGWMGGDGWMAGLVYMDLSIRACCCQPK